MADRRGFLPSQRMLFWGIGLALLAIFIANNVAAVGNLVRTRG